MSEERSALVVVRGLSERAPEDDVELVYVNDNYGDWHGSPEHLPNAALEMMEINMDAELCASSEYEMRAGG